MCVCVYVGERALGEKNFKCKHVSKITIYNLHHLSHKHVLRISSPFSFVLCSFVIKCSMFYVNIKAVSC